MIGRGAHSLAALAIASSTGRSPSDQEVDALVKAYAAHYAAHPVDKTRLYAGVREGLASDGRDGGATRGDALRG